MSATTYHHLLVIIDWEIAANELFLTEAEVEAELRALVADPESRLLLGEGPHIEEILAAKNLPDLREELEELDITIYVQTIDAPATPPAPDMNPIEYNTVMIALLDHSDPKAIYVADSLRQKFGKHAPQRTQGADQ